MMVAWIEIEDEEGSVNRWRIDESDERFTALEQAIGQPDSTKV